MATIPAGSGEHRSSTVLYDLMFGHVYASALRAVVDHGIPDLLGEGPRAVEELAERSGTRVGPLRRVLRLLSERGVFRESAGGVFGLTDVGEALRADVPGSHRAAVLWGTDEVFRRSAEGLGETLRTGRAGFEAAFGTGFFAYLAATPEKGRVFDAAMTSLAAQYGNDELIRECPFPGTGTVVDVAGGQGGLLRDVLLRHPGLDGVLFDRPGTVERHLLDVDELKGRWRVEGGDVFDGVPPGGDVYLLKNILHNWSDEDCLRILGSVRRAAAPGSRLLVIDAVLPEDGSPHPAVGMDTVMLMLFEGRERTATEFEGLLGRSGFRMSGAVPTTTLLSVVVAEAV
ncbi:methyltransferase [Streptomyces caatingaensis]|uniref:SAM-dependent methyltransferase n=1 Tax=Streptomyces caatingaensis TaxID=1678637 RepID=A0A0K9XDK7_9ACTN|nr:methyltransferase [Streptomyces caatingaensis]KNB51519.1 SAM-dependent methyltransferase [Streptomyces caatingaensis]